MIDLSLLDTTSPTNGAAGAGATAAPILHPGELLRNSGKFTKPTKIPGKNYSKDEVVIRNADSGKGEWPGWMAESNEQFVYSVR